MHTILPRTPSRLASYLLDAYSPVVQGGNQALPEKRSGYSICKQVCCAILQHILVMHCITNKLGPSSDLNFVNCIYRSCKLF